MIGFYDYTVILTYTSLASAITGIFFSIGGNPFVGILCLMLSGLCDMVDGKVANTKKRTKREKDFGAQLDSLCDIVAFGVLPIVIGYCIGMDEAYFIPVFIVYGLGALIRLAYFNMLEIERQNSIIKKPIGFTGLPVTVVALIFPFIYGFKSMIGTYFPLVYSGFMVLIAFAFVSKIKFQKQDVRLMILFVIIGIIELCLILKGVILK